MKQVVPQKSFGQHFLQDNTVLEDIVLAIRKYDKQYQILEIGPGMGALTDKLLPEFGERLYCIEVDARCVEYLDKQLPALKGRVMHADFLKVDLEKLLSAPTLVVGNFPYNISTQIIWKILDHHQLIPVVIGMFQKEVAQRLVAAPGSKVYGIQSVMTALYYSGEVLFDIPPAAFYPPPKVMSSVICLQHHHKDMGKVDVVRLKQIVKAAFNQRRKMLRNGLGNIFPKDMLQQPIFEKRAEQLSLQDYINLSQWKP